MKKTKAFVLSYLKYGDSSMIVKCYTEEFGFKSFIIKNVFSKRQKKHHFLFTLNEVDITFYPKKDNSLALIKELSQGYVFKNSYTDIVKSSIITFIGEILNQILKMEESEDKLLYTFIKDCLIHLDDKEQYFSDFHLYFLLELTRYLGFYPLAANDKLPYFNLREGVFSETYNISKEENSTLWNKLLKYDFNESNNCFSSIQRDRMLEEIISYYDLHLSSFKKPLSLEILKILFSKN